MLVLGYVVLILDNLCVGSRQRRWGSKSYARSSYMGPRDWLKKASDFDIEYSSNIELRLFFFLFFFIAMFSPPHTYIINQIAIHMCNRLKCWSKCLLP